MEGTYALLAGVGLEVPKHHILDHQPGEAPPPPLPAAAAGGSGGRAARLPDAMSRRRRHRCLCFPRIAAGNGGTSTGEDRPIGGGEKKEMSKSEREKGGKTKNSEKEREREGRENET